MVGSSTEVLSTTVAADAALRLQTAMPRVGSKTTIGYNPL
jgi:hypothetical protein